MKILIIEDEINAYNLLSSNIQSLEPTYSILPQIESVEDAVNWFFINDDPDLIFLDIQLSDGQSFEIFEHVKVSSPIIFTTAYDQYALEAFKVNSIDYLLKPIHISDLSRAIKKFNNQQVRSDILLNEPIQVLLNELSKSKKQRCLVKKSNHFEFINIANIAFVNSEDGLTFLHTFDGSRHLYNKSVESLMKDLDCKVFYRINRAQIININIILKIHPYVNQRLKIEAKLHLKDIDFIVSRSNFSQFRKWVDS